MSKATEQAAKSEQVPMFFGDEVVMMDRWTVTTLKAQAYDEGKTIDEIFHDAINAIMNDPAVLERVKERCRVEVGEAAH